MTIRSLSGHHPGGHPLSGFLGSAFAAENFSDTLVFGELVPKRVAMRKAEPLALAMSGLTSGLRIHITKLREAFLFPWLQKISYPSKIFHLS